MRILGLDYGDKNIGVAFSDSLNIIANGLETIRRPDEISIKKSISRLKEIIKEYQIILIVLGYPKNMNNSEGFRCEKTLEFKARLERNFKKIPVELWDERLSTIGSKRILQEANLSSKKIKNIIDMQSAVYILQNYLDYKNKNKNNEEV